MLDEETKQKFGTGGVTKGDAVKAYKQKAADAHDQKGVDNRERSIIQQIEKNLQTLADLTDIKSGNVFAVLKKLNKLIEDQIAQLETKNEK